MVAGANRLQRTIRRPVDVSGVGFFNNADVSVRFLPAEPGHGIAFQRSDLTDSEPIAAVVGNTVAGHRRTVLQRADVFVEMIEHAMAALAGLQIDNCLVQVNGPELPGLDGSCLEFCQRLFDAGIDEQDEAVQPLVVRHQFRVVEDDGDSEIRVTPVVRPIEAITYQLDYGDRSPVPPQMLSVELTPDVFTKEIAFARTYVLESEVAALKARGYGQRVTAKDLLVFTDSGVLDNRLRAPDECVRHKILDCVGDFALAGSEVIGHFHAWRSGHHLNRRTIQRLAVSGVETPDGCRDDAA